MLPLVERINYSGTRFVFIPAITAYLIRFICTYTLYITLFFLLGVPIWISGCYRIHEQMIIFNCNASFVNDFKGAERSPHIQWSFLMHRITTIGQGHSKNAHHHDSRKKVCIYYDRVLVHVMIIGMEHCQLFKTAHKWVQVKFGALELYRTILSFEFKQIKIEFSSLVIFFFRWLFVS